MVCSLMRSHTLMHTHTCGPWTVMQPANFGQPPCIIQPWIQYVDWRVLVLYNYLVSSDGSFWGLPTGILTLQFKGMFHENEGLMGCGTLLSHHCQMGLLSSHSQEFFREQPFTGHSPWAVKLGRSNSLSQILLRNTSSWWTFLPQTWTYESLPDDEQIVRANAMVVANAISCIFDFLVEELL